MRHENTDIYKRSLELNRLCEKIVRRLPKGTAFLADQLRRSASSVTLNFAEGNRRTSVADRRRFFTDAGGSAYEVSAAVDIAHTWDAVNDEERARIKDLVDHLSAMLRNYR